jgi:dGTPase
MMLDELTRFPGRFDDDFTMTDSAGNETSDRNAAETAGFESFRQREAHLLAPYAMFSAHSRGRKYPEPEHPYRSPFQRDRDRIVHCAAFRRLSDKTQVFTDRSDYHRTRLTHTMEVASIARTLGRALRLNEDLVEALALLHDIGHPPFGHAGEDALGECLAREGGFSHNEYALTIVEQLERRYQRFPGLNLTCEALESQSSRIDKVSHQPGPLLEAQVVEAADSITYDAHDVDDAVKIGFVPLGELLEIPLVDECLRRVTDRFGALEDGMLRKAVVHELIDFQVGDVLKTSLQGLAQGDFADSHQARQSDFRVGPTAGLAERKAELETFLYRRIYRHPDLVRVRSQAQDILRQMFEQLLRRPDLMPAPFRQHADEVGTKRAVAHYLAGMTDGYCRQQHEKITATRSGG